MVVALIVTAGLLFRADQQRKQELRDETVADLESSQSGFDSSREALISSLNEASGLELTDQSTMTDAALIDELVLAQAAAQDVADRAATFDVPDAEQSSNEELIAATDEMDDLSTELDSADEALTTSAGDVTDDVEAKRAADAAEAARLAEEQRLADEAAALAEKKSQAGPISYEELFRGGAGLTGNFYTFEGEVIQDAGADGELWVYRVNMTRDPGYSRVFWKDTIMVAVSGEPTQRILEDDIIAFTGLSVGVTSYETIFGATVEIPLLVVEGQDVAFNGRSE